MALCMLLVHALVGICIAMDFNDKKEEDGHLTYLHYPHFHFAGRFRADTPTLNNFPPLYDTGSFTPSDNQPTFDNWNPLGSGEWNVNASVTHVCYSDFRCVGDPKEEPLFGVGIKGGETQVPAKLVDLDPQAHKFAEVWGWRIVVGDYLSADFLPAPFQYRWVKTTNASNGDAEQAAAGQSILENIAWNISSSDTASKSKIWRELKDAAEKTTGKLSIRFNMDAFNEIPGTPYYGWGRITGTIGLTNANSSAFVPGERMLRALHDGLQDAPFILNKKAGKLTVDLGNSLPILKNGSHNVSFMDQLLVAMPSGMGNIDEPVSCSDQLIPLGVVLYRMANWYENSAGVQSFPPIGFLSEKEAANLETTPLVIAEVEGTWPAVRCKRILFSEAKNGIQVHPITPWVLRAEPGDHVEINLLATKFGRPVPGTTIQITPFVCHNIFYEYGGPEIGTFPLPFPAQNQTSDKSGVVSISFQAHDPGEPRKYIDGQLYPYVYWANSNPVEVGRVCNGSNFLNLLNSYIVIRVFSSFTYQEPPTWNEDVYPIFNRYATLFPVMTQNYVDLGNYHEVMTHIFLIDMTLRLPMAHPNFMPVTRDLSRDKLDMILKWIDHPCPGDAEVFFSIELLRQHLQTALEVEHSTIPTYLTALATIKDNYNVEVQAIFRQILIQEMLHLALVANILNAVGGTPVLFSKNFIPFYPSAMPGGLMPELVVPIEKCSISLIGDIFMKIEQPRVTADSESSSVPSTTDDNDDSVITGSGPHEHLQVSGQYDKKGTSRKKGCGHIPKSSPKGHLYPGERKPIFHKHYNTIGEFYDHILHALAYLTKNGTNQTIFSGDKSKQLFFDFSFGHHGRLINVTDFESAKQAIQEIVREGEGSSPCNPFDWKNDTGDLSHYFLFKSIVEGHEINVCSKDGENDYGKESIAFFKICHGEYFFNGTKIFFDSDGVWPMVSNPRQAKFVPSSRADVMNREFNQLYTNLLRSLEVTLNGHPEKFNDALGLMFSIDRHLKKLVRTPLAADGDPNVGPNAGPTFEFAPS